MTSIADIWLILKTLRNLNIKKLKNLRNANSGKYHTLLMHFLLISITSKTSVLSKYNIYNIDIFTQKYSVLYLSLYKPFSKKYIIDVFIFILINN